MFNKILIANRGEIACRIIKTARRLGILSVAVYSVVDKDSPHVHLADEAYCIGGAKALDSYLNIEAILNVARLSKADAIHPGYGFLSENSEFARHCAINQLVFIGPPISAMEIMGSKQLSKQLLERTNVPLTPGFHGDNQSDEELLKQAKLIGFPVLLKAANGGGGKGMRAVLKETDFTAAILGARREAQACFANDLMLIEKLIDAPRHIEIQIMADNFGNIVHLFERDCSIQRRHQKIIEEAPATNLSPKLRRALTDAAITVARKIDYRGAGTVEFLVKDEQFYFMEMNTRLQVEHPVTELITGFDLVEWQLLIAANEPLPVTQDQITAQGHAIECRIYAEDPRHDFLPSIGQLHFLKEPSGTGIRIDSGVTEHSAITAYYDPMIAKLITFGENRMQALKRMKSALNHYHIGGVKTNIPFLNAIVAHKDFINESFSTHFLSLNTLNMSTPNAHNAAIMAACFDYLHEQMFLNALDKATFGWQIVTPRQWQSTYLIHDERFDVTTTFISANQATIRLNETIHTFKFTLVGNTLTLDNGQQNTHVIVESYEDEIIFYTPLEPIRVRRFSWQNSNTGVCADHQLTSPMPATIVALLKQVGDHVKKGEGLIVLEAMKMEHTIYAPHDGILVNLFYELGAQVKEGAQLVDIQEDETQSS